MTHLTPSPELQAQLTKSWEDAQAFIRTVNTETLCSVSTISMDFTNPEDPRITTGTFKYPNDPVSAGITHNLVIRIFNDHLDELRQIWEENIKLVPYMNRFSFFIKAGGFERNGTGCCWGLRVKESFREFFS